MYGGGSQGDRIFAEFQAKLLSNEKDVRQMTSPNRSAG